MEKLRVEFVDFEDIVVDIVIVSNIVEYGMVVVKYIVEMEIMHRGTIVVEVDRMGYFQN